MLEDKYKFLGICIVLSAFILSVGVYFSCQVIGSSMAIISENNRYKNVTGRYVLDSKTGTYSDALKEFQNVEKALEGSD